MKSFFKGLSLVLVALMVVTAVPARQTKAADALNATLEKVSVKADAQYSFVDDTAWAIGTQHKVVISGTGLSKEDAAAQTITSSDEAVIKVVDGAKGTIQVMGYGSARLIVKAGSFTDELTIGIYTKRTFTGKQTTYNTVALTFATEEAAKNAKEKVAVKRVITTPDGAVYEIKASNARANINATNKKVVEITGITLNSTYKFGVGTEEPLVVKTYVGNPKVLVFGDLDVAVGIGKDLAGDSVQTGEGVFNVKVLDEEGKELKIDNANIKVEYEFDNDVNASFSLNDGKPTVSFAASEDGILPSIDIIGTVYYKENPTDDDDTSFSMRTTYEATKYVKPAFKGNFVYAVGLCAPDKDGEDIKDVFVSDFNKYIELNVTNERNVVFYFVADDGKDTKYSGYDTNAITDEEDQNWTVVALDSEAYKFWYKLENDNKVLSLEGESVVAWSEGKETILIYQQDDPTASYDSVSDREDASSLVGIVNVKVAAAPYVASYGLSTKTLKGYTDSIKTSEEITFELKDQNGDKFPNTTIVVYDEKGEKVNESIVKVTKQPDENGKGKIKVYYSALTKEQTYKFRIKADDALKGSAGELLTVTKAKTNGSTKYTVNVKDVKVNTKIASDSVNSLCATITVQELKGDAVMANKEFGVLDCTTNDISTFRTEQIEGIEVNNLYLIILDPTGTPVSANLHVGTTGGLAFATCSTVNASGNVVYTQTLCVDLYDDGFSTEQNIIDNVKFGTYSIWLYQCTASTSKDKKVSFSKKTSNAVTFTVSNALETIYVDPEYQLTVDEKTGKYVVAVDAKNDKLKNDVSTVSGADDDDLIKKAILKMHYALDTNSDGKYTGDGEVGVLSDLIAAEDIILKTNNRSYILGANGKSVYLKSVDIVVNIPQQKTGAADQTITYTVTFNTSINTNGVN